MSCPSELTLLMHADHELEPDEVSHVELHLAACLACQQRLNALRMEGEVLSHAVEALPVNVPVPAWRPPESIPSWLWLGVASALLAPGSLVLVSRTFPDWMASLGERALLSLFLDTLVALIKGGQTMLVSTLSVGICLGVALLTVLLLADRTLRPRVQSLPVVALTLVGMLMALPVHALELRQGDVVKVNAGESIDDRVVLTGTNVTVEGSVQGDVVVAGRHVVIRGPIAGNLYAAGEVVEVQGSIAGNAHVVAGTIRMESVVDGSTYLAGQHVTLTPTAKMERDLAVVGKTVRIEGTLRRNVEMGCEEVHLVGSIGRDLRVYAASGHIEGTARIGGSLLAKVAEEARFAIDPQAIISGKRSVEVDTEHFKPEGHDRIGSSVPGAVYSLLVTLILAFLAIRFAPRFVAGLPHELAQVGRPLGIGFVLLVCVPIGCLIVALTIVGIPLAIITLCFYLVGCYLASVVTAVALGRQLLRSNQTVGRVLLGTGAAWAIFYALKLIPFVGGGVGFLVVLFGLGCLFQGVRTRMAAMSSASTL